MMDFLKNIVIGTTQSSPSNGVHLSQPEVFEAGAGQREDKQVSYGFVAKQGRRGSMEDFTYSQFRRCNNGDYYGFFGVFDGHGGPGAASYVKENLFVKLQNDPNFPHDMSKALTSAFLATDQDYLNSSSDNDGCTGVVAVVKNRQVWIAHVGDSRAVLVKPSGQVEALSEDHKPNRSSERVRIEEEGGVVIWAGTWRVGGVLAVSRAFGDRPLKRYVIALPDVDHRTMETGGECIILASDGLWDVIEEQDAAMITQEQENPDPQQLAQELVHEAYARGSADNISCVVIQFSDI